MHAESILRQNIDTFHKIEKPTDNSTNYMKKERIIMTLNEIILLSIKTIVSYFFLIIILRIMGKREMSQVSTFDIVVFLIISELFSILLTSFVNADMYVEVLCLLKLAMFLSNM